MRRGKGGVDFVPDWSQDLTKDLIDDAKGRSSLLSNIDVLNLAEGKTRDCLPKFVERVTAADWVSRNRYVRVYSELRTEKQNAFIESFLRSFPSTLH